jgi:hypothetical protein
VETAALLIDTGIGRKARYFPRVLGELLPEETAPDEAAPPDRHGL